MSAAPFDYAPLKLVADTLIPQFGKAIVLSRAARDVGLEPWEQDQGPAAASAAQSISGLSGVQINLDRDGLALQTVERRLGLWAVQASTSIPEEVGIEWRLTADGNTFNILNSRPVRPGDTLLLYFITVIL